MNWLKFEEKPHDLPTKFIGCQWNAGWEFDAPAVLYSPAKFKRYGFGGNSGVIDSLVEDVCSALCEGETPTDGGLAFECGWRGWGPRFDRRKEARHVVITIEWIADDDGFLAWKQVSRVESYGPPKRTKLPVSGTHRT